MAELLEKEQAYRDKESEAGDKEMVSESSDNEMAQRQPLKLVNIKNQKIQIWNLKEIQTFHILKKPQVRRFCLKEKFLATVATERTFTKEQ